MTTQAWVFMLGMWTIVLGMTGYCFYKIMTSKRQFGGGER